MEESPDKIRIDIDSLPEETRRYILALAAQHDISPADATRIVLNYAATQPVA